MHTPFLVFLVVGLCGILAQAQGGPFNSTLSSSRMTLRPMECEKKLNIVACVGNNLKDSTVESEISRELKNTICAADCTNILAKISREYVEEQCGTGARLSFNFEYLMPILPTLSKFLCTTDSQGNMCAALVTGAVMQSGVPVALDPLTGLPRPLPVDKFPKSFTCSECAAKIQDAAKAADAAAAAKSPDGKRFAIHSMFPYDDASVAARKATCPGAAESSPTAKAGGSTSMGGSNSAGRNAGAATWFVGVLSAVVLVMA
ncbi:hypothetical protein BCR44DRAFT_1425672 [Catenaria anguillulae PL171]|uniref:Saposin B-type domain-containing protein n=1 Tax=Catenaria anguillulae PL171 TaxID=765915 RepID=A0A1Y2I1E7_9FUNG|nr:hypothetical protein BCR44DRAFT_1425672 [Catenaria anguillulae PL171]